MFHKIGQIVLSGKSERRKIMEKNLHVEVTLQNGEKEFLDEYISKVFFDGGDIYQKELHLCDCISFVPEEDRNEMINEGIDSEESFRRFTRKKKWCDEFIKNCFLKNFKKNAVNEFFKNTESCITKHVDVFFAVFFVFFELPDVCNANGNNNDENVGGNGDYLESSLKKIKDGFISPKPDVIDDDKKNIKKGVVITEEVTIETAQIKYEECQKNRKVEHCQKGILSVSSNLTIFYGDSSGFLIGLKDEFWFKDKTQKYLSETCAAIEKSGYVIVVGKLQRDEKDKDKFYFLANGDSFNYELLKKKYNDTKASLIVFHDNVDEKILSFEFKLNIKKVDEEKNKSLCIDFGTCNTTVGSYGRDRKPELVEFFSEVDNKYLFSLPTIVYVKNIKDGKPEYLFGYDAQKRIIECDYTPRATVFREIKRWMGDVEKEEELYDEGEYNNPISVKRKDIIKAYIDFVIKSAEAWFKCSFKKMHFTVPVRMKYDSLNVLKGMFKDYEICEGNQAIDEAVAVVYDYIERNIEEERQAVSVKKSKSTILETKIIADIEKSDKLNLTPEQKKNIIATIGKTFADDGKNEITVIDCGGGTTDVAHCWYKWDGNDRKLKIVSQFENGSSCYAGNNITYRILQLLKIKIYENYEKKFRKDNTKNGNELVDFLLKDRNEIIGILDGNSTTKGYCEVYEVWDKKYLEAENYIPTKFADTEISLSEEEINLRRRNYCYLWEMAEKFKKRFFESDKIVALDFSQEKDVEIVIDDMGKYYLNFNCDGEFKQICNPLKDVELNHKEIEHVVYADIYKLLKDVMPDDLGRGKFRLSGQSCNISLFQELLKEFIPGKNLSKRKFNRLDLKQSCILGAIKFRRDSEFGGISPEIENSIPVLNYIVRYMPVMNESPIVCLQEKDDELFLNYVELPKNTDMIKFQIVSSNDDCCREVEFSLGELVGNLSKADNQENRIEKMQKNTYHNNMYGEEIRELVTKISNRAKDGCYYIALLPNLCGYGFNLYLFQKDGNSYKMAKYDKVIPYVDDNVEIFFDGKH